MMAPESSGNIVRRNVRFQGSWATKMKKAVQKMDEDVGDEEVSGPELMGMSPAVFLFTVAEEDC